jgi:hypothetical protein
MLLKINKMNLRDVSVVWLLKKKRGQEIVKRRGGRQKAVIKGRVMTKAD